MLKLIIDVSKGFQKLGNEKKLLQVAFHSSAKALAD